MPVSAPNQPHSEERASHPGARPPAPLQDCLHPTWFSITPSAWPSQGQQHAYLIKTLLTMEAAE